MAVKSKDSSSSSKKRKKSENLFPVVGIGASAGGLTAFKKLLKAIPEDTGMAFLFVQHLDPDHESMLPDILQKETNMPVAEISEECNIEPNHIYVMPSDKLLGESNGKLQLTSRPPKKNLERILPIDRLFAAIAEIYNSLATG